MTRFVLDASVALAWSFKDEVSPYAAAAMGTLDLGRAIVPLVRPLEISNALAFAVRRGRIDEILAYRIHRTLHQLPIEFDHEMADNLLGLNVLRLSIDRKLTSYDASYLELAIRRGLPLATQDQRLAQAATAAGVAILEP